MSVFPPVTASFDEQLRALREGCAARPLGELALIEVRGADRATWLNGLVTQDTRALVPGQCVYGAAVAVKGKILADLHVYARAESLLIALPASQRELVSSHLERYIVMEDVSLALLDAAIIGVVGPRSDSLDVGERYETDRLGAKGFDVIVPSAGAEEFPSTLAAALSEAKAVWVGEAAWETARVLAGVPRFGVDFGAANFVQEASITPRAVSFNKGCYLGQEVVCRLEMRGHVQKQLLLLRVESGCPTVGDPVQSEGKDVGEVTSVAVDPSGGATVIAMVRHAAIEKPLEVRGEAASPRALRGA